MAYLDLEHCKLHFRVDGAADAPLLVLSNALGTDLSLWDAQLPVFARNFRVLRYDKRGHGQSSVSSVPVTIEMLAGDVIALADHVGAERFSFCGISVGGLIGLQLALKHPNRLDAIVIANTAARIGTTESWNARIEAVQQQGLRSIVEATMGRWFTAEFNSRHGGIVDRFRECFVSMPSKGYIHCCEAIRDADLRALVSGIRVPTLVVTGSQDRATTIEDGRFLVENIAGSRYVELQTAHLSNVEWAEEFSEQVVTFLIERNLSSNGMAVRRQS